MCGITGIISPIDTHHIEEFTSALKHRGPDNLGIFKENNIALGHTRLAIQDITENSNQPFENDDYALVYNGEIYNHWELRTEFQSKYPFNTKSDTETLFYGLIEFGKEFIKQLNGIFAFAFYDKKTKQLLLVRDHFGVKPLYYSYSENGFYFASELKSFTTLPNFNTSLNPEAIVDYCSLLYATNNKTPYKSVSKLEAGHLLELKVDNITNFKISKYYNIPFQGKYPISDEKEAIELLDKQLHHTIKAQLISDVEVGFFLSGGLDSTLLVVLASKYIKQKKINCYTIHSPNLQTEGFSSDLKYAKLIAQQYNFNLNIINVDINYEKEFETLITNLDEPIGDSAALHMQLVCKQAQKDGIKVLISGTGADDIFSGYRRHQALHYEPIINKTPKRLGKIINKITSNIQSKKTVIRRFKKVAQNIEKSTIERLYIYHNWLTTNDLKNILSEEFKSKVKDYDPKAVFLKQLENIPKESNLLNQMLYWEIKNFLPENNLNFTDKIGMAYGIEIRVPYLDKDLVDLSTKINPSLKMNGKVTKYILKKVAEKYLPKELIYRPKTGFGASLDECITNEVLIQNYLSETIINKNKIFDYKKVNALLEENKTQKLNNSQTIWSILILEAWLKKMIN